MVNTVNQQKRIWGNKYSQYGLFFGEKASDTAAKFISTLKRITNSKVQEDEYAPALNILDVGAGTGRDSVAVALQTNANVDALDCSPQAIENGTKFAEEKGVGNRINWIEDDFLNFEPEKKYDAIFSHRWLHLNDSQDFELAVKKLSDAVKDTGLLVISARSFEDYNPNEMAWVDESNGIAEYITEDKKGMQIHLFNPEKFKKLFGEFFDMSSVDFSERVELDNKVSDRETKFIFMSVFKKSAEGEKVDSADVSVNYALGDEKRTAASAFRRIQREFHRPLSFSLNV